MGWLVEVLDGVTRRGARWGGSSRCSMGWLVEVLDGVVRRGARRGDSSRCSTGLGVEITARTRKRAMVPVM
jgi:hypothetical protein